MIKVLQVGNTIQLGIDAPKEVLILRGELKPFGRRNSQRTNPEQVGEAEANNASVVTSPPLQSNLVGNNDSPLGSFLPRNRTKR